jgi:hypothetical protein
LTYLNNLKKDYSEFAKVCDKLEKSLKLELTNYDKSGEKKDYIKAIDKLEELYKFLIIAKENEIQSM